MHVDEYEKVKNMTYYEYCDYLQNKYGIGRADYMTKAYSKTKNCTRTKEGLVVHHKMEDQAIMLSSKEFAQDCPFEWQLKENLVYCDYLEHLLLHVLICSTTPKGKLGVVGMGGIVDFIVPELNDLYSGWVTGQDWRKCCHNKVKDDKEVYFLILRQFLTWLKSDKFMLILHKNESFLCTSFNEDYGIWNNENNKNIYLEISKLWNEC